MDIFDDDGEVEIVSRPSTSASNASSSSSSRPLFLPDNNEEEEAFPNDNGGEEELGRDTVQDVVDNDFDSVLAELDAQPPRRKHGIDFDRMEREAQKKAKTKPLPRQPILSSSPPPPDMDNNASNNQKKGKGKGKDDGDQKERRKPMRLDEPRLVGPTGFPQLIEDTKHFRIKGKGSEATDLNRLLQIYQYWTHRMYPKSQFKDTVERVEKLCHSKLMHNKLSMWRDEVHGVVHSAESEVEKNGDEDAADTMDANPDETAARRASSPAPVSDAAAYASSSPSPPTRPPSSAALSNAGDEYEQDSDIWDQMAMAMDSQDAAPAANTAVQGNIASNSMDIDDDDEAWAALNAAENPSMTTSASTGLSPATASTSSKNANDSVGVALDDDDEEMWEISRQMEAEVEARKEAAVGAAALPNTGVLPDDTGEKPSRRISSTEDGFDDMYL